MRLSEFLGDTKQSTPPATRGNDYGPFDTSILRDALRSTAPGQWSSNKLALAQSMRGVAYLAINTLATQFSSAEPMLWERTDNPDDSDGRVRLSRLDPMYRLFDDPNPVDTWGDVSYQLAQQLGTTGVSLLWAPPTDSHTGLEHDEPRELYSIPTATAFPLPRSPQYPQGAYRVVPYYNTAYFAMNPGGNSAAGAVIPAEQIVRIKNHHPLLRDEGYAVLSAIQLSMDSLNAIDRSRWSTQMQGTEQTIALELDAQTQNPNSDEMKRIRQEWSRLYSGPDNAGKIVVTPPGAKLSKFSTSPDDMAWQEGWSQLSDFVLACYQTPKAIAGMSGDLTYATLYAALKQFYLFSLNPLCRKVSDSLTKHLIRPNYGREFLLELVAQKIDDESLRQGRLSNDIKVGALTIAEYRREQGYDELDARQNPWVLERAGAATPATPEATETPDTPQDPAETERPENPEGEGSLGPRKFLGNDRGDLLATAFEKHKTNGSIHSLNGKH